MINHRDLLAKYLRATGLDEPVLKGGHFTAEETMELGRLSAEPEPLTLMPCDAVKRPAGSKRGTRLPDSWQPSPDAVKFCRSKGVDPAPAAEEFKLFWWSTTDAKGVKSNWNQAFMVRVIALQQQNKFPLQRTTTKALKPGVHRSNISGTAF